MTMFSFFRKLSNIILLLIQVLNKEKKTFSLRLITFFYFVVCIKKRQAHYFETQSFLHASPECTDIKKNKSIL